MAAVNTYCNESEEKLKKDIGLDDKTETYTNKLWAACGKRSAALQPLQAILDKYTSPLDKITNTDAVTKECHAIEPKLKAEITKVDASASQRYVDLLWDACAKRNNAIRAKASADKK